MLAVHVWDTHHRHRNWDRRGEAKDVVYPIPGAQGQAEPKIGQG